MPLDERRERRLILMRNEALEQFPVAPARQFIGMDGAFQGIQQRRGPRHDVSSRGKRVPMKIVFCRREKRSLFHRSFPDVIATENWPATWAHHARSTAGHRPGVRNAFTWIECGNRLSRRRAWVARRRRPALSRPG